MSKVYDATIPIKDWDNLMLNTVGLDRTKNVRCIVCKRLLYVDEIALGLNLVCSEECMYVVQVNPLPYDEYTENLAIHNDSNYWHARLANELIKSAKIASGLRQLMKEEALTCSTLKSS